MLDLNGTCQHGTACKYIILFLPYMALFTTLLHRRLRDSVAARRTAVLVISCAAVPNVLCPAFSNPMLKYLQGFFTTFYVLYATEIMILNDPSALQYVAVSERRPSLSRQHLAFVLGFDMTFNFRAIGWSHGFKKATWSTKLERLCTDEPCGRQEQKLQTRRFLRSQAWKLLCIWLWLDVYIWGPRLPAHTGAIITRQSPLVHPFDLVLSRLIDQVVELLGLLAHTLTLRVLLDGVHSVYCFIAVGLLSQHHQLYPPLFGPLAEIRHFQVQVIWNNVWHDILGRTLMQATIRMAAMNKKWGRSRTFFLFVPFVVSGILHAAGFYSIIQNIVPAVGVFVFFSIQPIGIAVEREMPGVFRRIVPLPYQKQVVLLGHFLFIVIWFRLSLPLLWHPDVLRLTVKTVDVPGGLWKHIDFPGIFYST